MSTTLFPVLPERLQAALEKHAFSETEREVGGILIGSLHEASIEVTAFIPALKAAGSATNVTFTHEVWSDVLSTVERDHPSRHIVGWYHTHPAFGLFLSEYDLFIHRNFFSDPRMAALVVDPVAGEMGWFGWVGEEVREVRRSATKSAPITHAVDLEVQQTTIRNRLGRAALVAAGVAILAGSAGFALGSFGKGPKDDLAVAANRITQQQQIITSQELKIKRLEDAASPSKSPQLPPSSTPHPAGNASISTIVQPGDSWWALARRFYSNGPRFPELMQANPHVATLQPGQRIVIPGVKAAGR